MADPEFDLTAFDYPISLYVHIPFCRSRCFYCDFYSETDRSLSATVVDKLIRRTDDWLARMGRPVISTVYVGGGTPSILERSCLTDLLSAIAGWADGPPLEWTVEANPESMDVAFLKICESAGVNRLSVGLQSLGDGLLQLLGRGTSCRDNLRALDLIAHSWSGRVSVDLLTGIPGQDEKGLRADIERVLAYGPDHVSLYSLTREAGTEYDRRIRAGVIPRPSDGLAEDLWFSGRETLVQAGYVNYEISNFALPGGSCHHNMTYWRLDPYLGQGPSGVSTLPGGMSGVLRITQPSRLPSYLQGEEVNVETIPPVDFLFETLMMGLRLQVGVPVDRIAARFGRDVSERLMSVWTANSDRWDARIIDDSFVLGQRGRLFLNGVLQDILEEIQGWSDPLRIQWPGSAASGIDRTSSQKG